MSIETFAVEQNFEILAFYLVMIGPCSDLTSLQAQSEELHEPTIDGR